MDIINRHALLSVEDMSRADSLTIEGGVSGSALMEAAGLSLVRLITEKYDRGRVLILCGPGNNGGDGFVIARHLHKAGWPVDLALLGKSLKGDAAHMAAAWQTCGGKIRPLGTDVFDNQSIIIDALFGAGLSRPLDGIVAEVVTQVNDTQAQRVAVDVPSGVEGNSGQARGVAFEADLTVSFFRRKPAHLLYPGKRLCGEIHVTDMGISPRVLDQIKPETHINHPDLWLDQMPRAQAEGHKYSRGHALVVSGGPSHTGAARLAATAALRIGAGLVSVACPYDAAAIHAAHLTSVMVKPFEDDAAFDALLGDARIKAWCVGPGNGVSDQTRERVLKVLSHKRRCVLDADALTVFAGKGEDLWTALTNTDLNTCVMTPHDKEFSRLFPDLDSAQPAYDKLASARKAAKRSGATLILKGADTVIAHPDGRAVICENGPPELATAGSGDVLAGLVTGLLAQGMESFEASGAATWILGEAAKLFGPGLISEDIEQQVPAVLSALFKT